MNRREFISQSSKLVTAGAIISTAGCTGSSKPDSASITIDSFGNWNGSIGGDGGSRSIQGYGTETYRFQEVPDIISATIQKQEQDRTPLTVYINADGETVKQSTTEAGFGVVSVSHSFL